MGDAETLHALLKADVGDGLLVGPRRYPITALGQSAAADGFATREFSLGQGGFYLVVEGPLAGVDPARCRAVLTHELASSEVRFREDGGRARYVTAALRESDDPPPTIHYHGRPYQFIRRTDARYRGPSRTAERVTWDYQAGTRNLAVERWPLGEMAVYEGEVVPFGAIRVLPDYGPPRPVVRVASPIGILVGIAMMALGFLMVFVD